MKSLGVQWMVKAVDYMMANPIIITNEFRAAARNCDQTIKYRVCFVMNDFV